MMIFNLNIVFSGALPRSFRTVHFKGEKWLWHLHLCWADIVGLLPKRHITEAPAEGSQPLNLGASLTRNHLSGDME